MNRKRRTILLLFLPLTILMVVSAGAIYRDYQQQRLNRDLIAALKQNDVATEVRLVNAGADANARDMGDRPVTVLGVLRDYWQRRRTGKPTKTEFHTPALLVFMRTITGPLFKEKAWIARTMSLLDHGAKINSQDEDGSTLLHCACQSDSFHLAQLLIDRGADVNIPDDTGRPPLAYAISFNCLENVKALLKVRAKVNQQGPIEINALGEAKQVLWEARNDNDQLNVKRSEEIIRLLKQAGAHE